MKSFRRGSIAAAAGLVLAMTACGGDGEHTIQVSAASSLAGAFSDMEAAYEAATPGADVVVNFGGSPALRDQILEGAPIDVFASANEDIMDEVVDAGLAGEPVTFALNHLEIAVPAGNSAGVTGLDDFGRSELLIGVCADGVPCGTLARTVLADAAVEPSIDSNEPNVRALLTKLEEGELDAGLVYTTDALDNPLVESITVADTATHTTAYPIAVTTVATDPAAADGFVSFVLSTEGRAILEAHGFMTP